ncbi:MAG: DUF1538 domain-containing protein [Firmicutes bacterium]|nr:DUF1538 domain-containing protein [Bacillota bacterium]
MKLNLKKHLLESIRTIAPITIVATIFALIFVPSPLSLIINFVISSMLLIVGIMFFKVGVDIAFIPVGDLIGATIQRKRKVWFLVIVGITLGTVATLAEPGAHVLVGLTGMPFWPLLVSISVGVGVFFALALVRMFFRVGFRYIILGGYLLIFLIVIFVPNDFLPTAFDLGGATMGEMTVPFIMTLGVGIASAQKNAKKDDNFGLIAICPLGAIIAAMVLRLIVGDSYVDAGNLGVINYFGSLSEMGELYLSALGNYSLRILIAIAPIVTIFLIFQFISLKLSFKKLCSILLGFLFLYIGVALFLIGVTVGFLPMGQIIGYHIASSNVNFMLIIAGIILGAIVILAEPAVYVLIKEIAHVAKGRISKLGAIICLCSAIAVAIALSMIRVMTGVNFLWIAVPAYVVAIALSFIVPKLFSAVAFDAGGVASGPLMAGFLLPLSIGASYALGGNILADAFGLIAFVALFPIIAFQILGLVVKIKTIKKIRRHKAKCKYREENDGQISSVFLPDSVFKSTVEIEDNNQLNS